MTDILRSYSEETHVSPEEVKSPNMLMSPLTPSDNKIDFLAAYGLELDEEDDDDEEEDDDSSPRIDGSHSPRIISKIAKRRIKLQKQKSVSGTFLNKALASPRRISDASLSPSSSPRAQSRRATLVNLVRSKSPASTSDSGYKSPASVLSSPIHPTRPLIDYASRGNISPRGTTKETASRRGFLSSASDDEEEQSIFDDTSSASHYPPPTFAHLETTMDSHPSGSGASSHTQITDEGLFEERKVSENKTDESASSVHEEKSFDNAKVGGALVQPPSLPARPITTPSVQPVSVMITPAPALPPRRSVSKPVEAMTKEEVKQAKVEQKDALAKEKIMKEKLEDMARKEEIDTKILMKSYEELEVERFLADFGKHVRQVKSIGFIDTTSTMHVWPQREEWRHAETGQLNVAGFTFAYLLSIFTYLSPNRFMDLQAAPSTPMPEDFTSEFVPEEQFRIAALRTNAERLYLTALPMYEGLFDRARKIWRWDSLFKSSLWCTSYFLCWYRGMLLPALFGLIIWSVLVVRSYPPKPQELREMLTKQQKRTKELQQAKKAKAEDIIRQAQEEPEGNTTTLKPLTKRKKSKYGLAADATRRYGKVATIITSAMADVHERIKNFIMWRSVPATWRALTLLFISMIVTFLSIPWMIARFPGFMLGISFFIVGPIAEHRPEWMGVEWSNPFDFILAGVPNDAQHAMQVLRKRAAAGEALVGDVDVIRWIQGTGEEDEEDEEISLEAETALLPVMPSFGDAPGVSAVSTAVDQAKAKGSSAIDWKKWRATMNRGREMAVAGSEMLSGQRQLELPRLGAPAEDTTVSMKMLSGMSKGINWGIDSLQNSSNRKLNARILEPNEEMSASDGIYWAVHQGSCGHVVVTPEKIRFRSFFARKMSVDTLTGVENKVEEVPVVDPITGKILIDEKQMEQVSVRTLLDVRLESVVALKKTKTVNVPGVWGIDGLEVRSRGGKVSHFSSIVKRDEAFNRILALAPQNWSKM